MNGARGFLAMLVLAGLLVVLGVCFERFVLASDPGPAPTYLELLQSELVLRDDQVSAIAEILADEDAAIETLRQQRVDELRAPIAARRSLTETLLIEQLDESQRQLFGQL